MRLPPFGVCGEGFVWGYGGRGELASEAIPGGGDGVRRCPRARDGGAAAIPRHRVTHPLR